MLLSGDTAKAERLEYGLILEFFCFSNSCFFLSAFLKHCPCQVYASNALILSKQACRRNSSRLLNSDNGACSIVIGYQFVLEININGQRYIASLVEYRSLERNLNHILSEGSKCLAGNNSCQNLTISLNLYGITVSSKLTFVGYSSNHLSGLTGNHRLRSLDVSNEIVLIEIHNADIINYQAIVPVKDIFTSALVLTLILRRSDNVNSKSQTCEALTLSIGHRNLYSCVLSGNSLGRDKRPVCIVNACINLSSGNIAKSLSIEQQGWVSTFNLDLTRFKLNFTSSIIGSHEHCTAVII